MSTLGDGENLAPWSPETWVGKTEIELRNLLSAATAQINQEGTKKAFGLLSIFLLILKQWIETNRAMLLLHFRSVRVDRTWMRRQLIRGALVKKKEKGKTTEQWQDERTLTVSDIRWLTNRERQELQSVLGLSWIKAFDETLARFVRLPSPQQHDLYKDMLARFETIKSQQTEFVRAVSAKSGKRKNILKDMGLITDVKKKDPYQAAIAFISKPNLERLVKNADGTVDNDKTAKFHKAGKIDSFIHLLPSQFADRSDNDLERTIMPEGFFQGKYYLTNAKAATAENRIRSLVMNAIHNSPHPSTQTEINTQNLYEVLVGILPQSDVESSDDEEENNEAPPDGNNPPA
jgi:hypothetical protein